MNGQAGTHSSMFAAYFPGEKYTIVFEPKPEQADAITRMVTARSTSDAESETMLQMLGIIPSERPLRTAHEYERRRRHD